MDVHRSRWTLRTAAVLAALTLVPLAGPAAAGPAVTRCADLGPQPGPGTVVEGDLLVDHGPCDLTGAVVHGDVRVADAPYTYLLAFDSTIEGTLSVAGHTQLYRSAVGAVQLTGPAATLYVVDASAVAGDIRGEAEQLSVFRSDVGGGVSVRAHQAAIAEVAVGRDVQLTDGYAWVWGSTVGGRLDLTRSSFITICGSRVAGDVTVRHASEAVDVGLAPAETSAVCADQPGYPRVTTVGGTFSLLGNAGPVQLTALHVARDLVCRANTGGVTELDDVTVGGTRRGQCGARPS